MTTNKYYLSLGSNLGEREQTLRQALCLIEQQVGKIACCSSFYYSAPWGFDSPNGFCNLCCLVETEMEPLAVLRATQGIERTLGREEKSHGGRYTDRRIDIDLIQAFDAQGNEIRCHITDEEGCDLLTLPHPLYEQRAFVLIPLQELQK